MSISTFCDVAARLRDDLTSILTSEGFKVPEFSKIDVHQGVVDALSAYLRIRFRSISNKTRTVQWSSELKQRPVTVDTRTALDLIQAEFESANVVALTQRLTRQYYDSKFDDRLLNDLGVLHLHLGPLGAITKGNHPMAGGADDLLFVYIDGDVAYFLDARGHKSGFNFDDYYFMGVIQRNWPDLLKQYIYPRVLGINPKRSSEERAAMRKAGFSVPLEMNGDVYASPGGGIMSNGMGVGVALGVDKVLNGLREYIDEIEKVYGLEHSLMVEVAGNVLTLKDENTSKEFVNFTLDW